MKISFVLFYVICKFLIIFLHDSLSCPVWSCSQAEHVFWWQREILFTLSEWVLHSLRELYCKRLLSWFCLTPAVKKQSLRKLFRIFDLGFPAVATGSFITSCLCWFWYLKLFVSQPFLFNVCWYLSVLVAMLHFSLNTAFSFLGAYFPDT